MTGRRTPVEVTEGTWRGNCIRTARKAGRCDYYHGVEKGRCKNRIEPGDLYLEGEMNDSAGGYGMDRYCIYCVRDHEGIAAALTLAKSGGNS